MAMHDLTPPMEAAAIEPASAEAPFSSEAKKRSQTALS
jgi:hypothetical protein